MEKTTSREEALKRIISQKDYDRLIERNKEWDAEEAQRNYRLLYVKAFYDSFPSNEIGGDKL
jgi:hypothetical protein